MSAIVRIGRVAAAAVALLSCAVPVHGQQLDENCTISVLNRTVQVFPDGSWLLPNIPANVGPVRARVTCTVDGKTISGESEPFVVPANGTVNVPTIVFGDTTPIPTSLAITAPSATLTELGAMVQLSVKATYPDGSSSDVSAAASGTVYTVSNAAIGTVSADGLVVAVSSGSILIQATQEGTSGLIRIQVSPAGAAHGGIADSWLATYGFDPADPTIPLQDPDRDNLTNLQEFEQGTHPRNADTDGDGLQDGDELTQFNTSPLLRDSDGDGVPDGIEAATGTNPTDANSYDLSRALKAIAITPAQFTLTFNTIAGDASRLLTVIGTLTDGSTIDLTSRQGDTQFTSSNLNICNFGATRGQVFAGQSGTCTVTATAGGFSAIANGTVHTFAPTALSFVTIPGYANNVDVNGDFAFIAAGSAGLQVVDVSDRTAPRIAASLALTGNANDVKVAGGRAFIAAGVAGLHIVDVSSPAAPRALGSLALAGEAWDVRSAENLVFVASGTAGLQIVDASIPQAPRLVGALPLTGIATGVDVAGTLAVVTVDSSLRVVDVSSPGSPVLLGSVTLPSLAKDVVVRANLAYVAAWEGSLQIVDFSDPSAPFVRGSTNSVLGGILMDVAVADAFAFGADVFFVNGVPIVNVSDPGNPIPRDILNFSAFRDDNGTGIAVDGSYVYLTAGAGIQDNGATGNTRLYIGQYRLVEDLDGIPPTVSILSPANGAVVVEGETIPVTIAATDDIAIASVRASLNGAVVATDTSAPYQLVVQAPLGASSAVLGASAIDLGGNEGIAQTIQLSIIPDPLTTVAGRAVGEDGLPISGASVSCQTQTGVTSADGTFTIAGVPTTQPIFICTLQFTTPQGTLLRGASASLVAVRAGTTPAGDVTLVLVPVTVATTTLPNGFVGQPYLQTLAATSTIGGVTWTLNPGSSPLPGGLTLASDGVISGIPTTFGQTPAFTVRATDSLGRSGTGVLAIFVDANLEIVTTELREGIVNENFDQDLVVIGGHGELAASITNGSLPPGMTVDGAGDAPTATGTYTFTLRIVDCSPIETCPPGTVQQTASRTFTLRVSAKDQQGGTQAGNPIPFGGPAGRRLAQTVTVGAAGTLNAFALPFVNCPAQGPVTVEVQRLTLGGLPDGVTIATGTSTIDGFNGIALTPTIPVTIDERLAFVVSSPTACEVLFAPSNDNGYQAGDAYSNGGSGWASLLSTDKRYDIPFRTLIEPAGNVVYFNRGRFDGARVSEFSGRTKVLVTGTDNTGDVYDQTTNRATLTPTMNVAPQRFSHTATTLNDGTILIAGGRNSVGTNVRLTSAEIYDPAANTYTVTGSMAIARESAAAVRLLDGRVLIVGGSDGSQNLASVEVYDPVARTFSSAGTMTTQRNWPVVVLLASGKVLIAGGYTSGTNQRTAEIYDPVAGTFTATTGNMVVGSRGRATGTRLNDGRVLITGGQSGDIRAEAEIYNPATDSFTATASPMSRKRFTHTATLLADGSVLVAGGYERQNVSGYILPLASLERYVPATNSFVPAGSMVSRRASHQAASLENGKVLLVGGVSNNAWFIGNTGEVYDPATTPVLTTTSLPDGEIGVVYAGVTLAASGGQPQYAIAHVSGLLPDGLAYDPVAASLTGTPLATGIFPLGFKVTDGAGRSSVQTLTVRVGIVNVISSPYRLPDVGRGNLYSVQLTATGTQPILWSMLPSSGALPAGLALSASGVISGTPTANGFINFAVRAVDATGQAAIASLSISVVNPLVLNTTVLPEAAVRENFTFCLSTSAGVGPLTSSATAPLPPGITLGANGCFANAPTTHGTFTASVRVADSSSPPAVITRDLTLRVSAREQEGFTGGSSSITFGGPGGRRLAQVVTVGANGGLSGFGLNNTFSCQSSGSVTVEVQRLTLAGLPDGNTIASGTASTGFNGISLTPLVPVSVGARLAFVLSAPNLCTMLNGSTTDFYNAGDAYANAGAGWQTLFATDGRYDLPFRTLIQPDAPVIYLNANRNGATATVLTNGKVLIAGNNTVGEVYDPATGLSTPTGAMTLALFNATASLAGATIPLEDGTVLVAGGSVGGQRQAAAFTYDPATGVFTRTANDLSVAREAAASVRLMDGRVLVVGGHDGSTNSPAADLYDPATRTFTTLANMRSGRNAPTATLLANGKVLIAGGFISGSVSAELYDPGAGQTGSFTPTTGAMVVFSRGRGAAVRLADGKVLITGGQFGDIVATAEIYDPITDSFAATGSMSVPRHQHTSTLLADGTALIAGGVDEDPVNNYILPLATTEKFDPVSGTFGPAAAMQQRRTSQSAVRLTNGKTLIAGGGSQSWMTGNTAELYDAATAPILSPSVLPDGQPGVAYPTTTFSGAGPGGPFTITHVAGVLPPGLDYNQTTRALSGTPTTPGSYVVGFKIASAVGSSVHSFTIRVGTVLSITSPYRLIDGALGQPYSLQLTSNGVAPVEWTVPAAAASSFPPGLTLSSSGLISGTPTSTGFFNFVVRVADATGQTAMKSVAISVGNALGISTAVLPEAIALENYTPCINTVNGIGNRTFSISQNSPPPGMVLQVNGCFANAPTVAGIYPFTVRVTDSASPAQVVTRDFTIRVSVREQSGYSDAGPTISFGGPGGRRLAQTVTVGANGTLIGFGFNRPTTCTVPHVFSAEVQKLAPNGLPDGTAVASAQVTSGLGGIALVPTLPVAVGMRLAFVLSSTTSCDIVIGSTTDFYQGGEALVDSGQGWVPLAGTDNRHDLPFRTLIQPATTLGFLQRSRGAATATVLDNGKVLLAGSELESEVYDPATNTSTLVGSTSVRRYNATATRLNDGTVLIAGGEVNGAYFDTAETFDPATGQFTPTANRMSAARNTATATKLPDGRVLIAGGWNGVTNLKNADLYDPATRTFTTLQMTTGRNVHTATLLNNGTVLITSGFTDGTPTARSAEIFNPATLSFTPTIGNMVMWRGWAAATLLADGRVLITGGQSGDIVNTAEIYDPATGQFTATGSMSARRHQHTATLLADGSVLVAGGLAEAGFWSYPLGQATMERWLPATGTFEPAGGLEARRQAHTATALPGNRILFAGSFGDSWASVQTAEVVQFGTYPVLTTTQLPDGQKNATYVPVTLTASGGAGGPYAIDLVSGGLPPGMSYDPVSATLSGAPGEVGVYTLGMRVRDALGQVNLQSLTLRIDPVIVTSPYRLPDARLGQPYALQLTGNAVSWSLVERSVLPPGLSMSASGAISGIATTGGYYNFVVRATDSLGQSVLKVLSIFVF